MDSRNVSKVAFNVTLLVSSYLELYFITVIEKRAMDVGRSLTGVANPYQSKVYPMEFGCPV